MERDCHIKNVLIWGTSCKQNVEKFSSLWGICCKQNIENILMWSISCKQNVQKVSTVMLFQLKNSFYKILWFSNFIVVSHSVLITEDNIPGGMPGASLRASSTGLSLRHSFLHKNFNVFSHMRSRAGSVTEISVTGMGIFRYERTSLTDRNKTISTK